MILPAAQKILAHGNGPGLGTRIRNAVFFVNISHYLNGPGE
jgi:hypothetical protein